MIRTIETKRLHKLEKKKLKDNECCEQKICIVHTLNKCVRTCACVCVHARACVPIHANKNYALMHTRVGVCTSNKKNVESNDRRVTT